MQITGPELHDLLEITPKEDKDYEEKIIVCPNKDCKTKIHLFKNEDGDWPWENSGDEDEGMSMTISCKKCNTTINPETGKKITKRNREALTTNEPYDDNDY